MAFDYSKLKGRIVEKFGNYGEFATAMGWSLATNGKKLSNKVMWQQDEIIKAIELLMLKISDIAEYFFTREVK